MFEECTIITRLSGPQEPPIDQSTSRSSSKPEKGKTKKPEYEDPIDNESTDSRHSELEGLDIPIIHINRAKKDILSKWDTLSPHLGEKPGQLIQLRWVYGISLCLYDEGGNSSRTEKFF